MWLIPGLLTAVICRRVLVEQLVCMVNWSEAQTPLRSVDLKSWFCSQHVCHVCFMASDLQTVRTVQRPDTSLLCTQDWQDRWPRLWCDLGQLPQQPGSTYCSS